MPWQPNGRQQTQREESTPIASEANRTPTVTCVGISVQDLVFSVAEPIELGAKNLATSMHTVGGGPAANAAVTIVSLGGDARLISKVGADPIGNAIVGDLGALGVNVSHVHLLDHVASPVSTVVVDSAGERTIFNHTDARLVDDTLTPTASDIKGSDAVLVDLRWPAAARSAIAAANTLQIPSVVDFDRTTDGALEDVVQAASHVVFSQPALLKLAGTSDNDTALLQISAQTDAFVAVTLGGAGIKWAEHGAISRLPAFPVKVVDTRGAGDVFHGAFALALALGQTNLDALRFAAAASAIKCSRPGGREGVPTLSEVSKLVKANT